MKVIWKYLKLRLWTLFPPLFDVSGSAVWYFFGPRWNLVLQLSSDKLRIKKVRSACEGLSIHRSREFSTPGYTHISSLWDIALESRLRLLSSRTRSRCSGIHSARVYWDTKSEKSFEETTRSFDVTNVSLVRNSRKYFLSDKQIIWVNKRIIQFWLSRPIYAHQCRSTAVVCFFAESNFVVMSDSRER